MYVCMYVRLYLYLAGHSQCRSQTPVIGDRGFAGWGLVPSFEAQAIWEFPKIRGTLLWGPSNKDPTI